MPRRSALAVLPPAVLASLLVALTSKVGLDYNADAGPGIRALAAGDLHRWAAEQPQMGQLSIVVRTPVQMLGLSELWSYRLGALVLLLGPVLLAMALWSGRRPRDLRLWMLVAVLCLNPITFRALELGHPEEPLGGALCALAVVLALDRRAAWSGLALGLALATKQWALFAVLPVLLACAGDGERRRVVAVAAPVAALFVVPPILADPHAFAASMNRPMAGLSIMRPGNIWSLVVPPTHFADVGGRVIGLPVVPVWLRSLAHPLVVGLAMSMAVAWRSRRSVAGPESALALLALLFLVRCLLDPWNHGYYHWPFVAALACWEVRGCRRLPIGTILSSAWLWVVVRQARRRGHGRRLCGVGHRLPGDPRARCLSAACAGVVAPPAGARPALIATPRRAPAARMRESGDGRARPPRPGRPGVSPPGAAHGRTSTCRRWPRDRSRRAAPGPRRTAACARRCSATATGSCTPRRSGA